jgi:FecR protein
MQTNSLKLKQTGLLIAGLLVSQLAFAASVGTVTFTTEGATITHADKTITPAKKSAELVAGDVIDTNAGRLQLSLIDGGKVSLQPNTTYKIERYEFASGKEDGSEYAITELVKGGLRTVSGLIGHKNRDHYQLKTAVATIGIRGTEFTVNFNDNNLLMTTNHGSVDVCNIGGCLNAVSGQTIQVAGLGASPKPSKEMAKAAAAAPAAKAAAAPAESGKAVFAAAEKTDVKKLAESQKPIVVAPPDVIIPPTTPLVDNRGLSMQFTSFGDAAFYDATVTLSGNDVKAISNLTAGIDHQNVNLNVSTPFYAIPNVLKMGVMTDAGTYVNGAQVGNVGDLYYIVGVAPDVNNLSTLKGTYTVAAQSPVKFNFGGGGLSSPVIADITPTALSPTGATPTNQIIGVFNFDFGVRTYNYGLEIPTSIGTYGISGDEKLGALNGNGTFGSNAIVTYTPVGGGNQVFLGTTNGYSTGSGLGTLGGHTVMGSFFGKNGQALGLQYGFNASGVGTVNTGAGTSVNGPVNGTLFGNLVLK